MVTTAVKTDISTISWPFDMVDFDFRTISIKWIFQPCDQREHSHRHGHSQICDHFSIIRKRSGKSFRKAGWTAPSKAVPWDFLGTEDERSHSDQWGPKGHITGPVKETESNQNQNDWGTPENQLCFWKVVFECGKWFHDVLLICRWYIKSIHIHIFKDLSMRMWMLLTFLPGGR